MIINNRFRFLISSHFQDINSEIESESKKLKSEHVDGQKDGILQNREEELNV